ncbi:MAG: 50S ribosomal protein L9 [Bacteroidales bacterium]|nr:50S ribosomal protein L9 [Bacteroidales bacterium]
MEIILIQDVEKLGYANDIVTVKNGYARNFLFPKKLAKPATESNRKVLAENIKQRAFKEDKIRNEAQAIANKLEDITIKIGTKSSETGKIFGSVNALQVADAIKTQLNIEVDRKKITIDGESIKEIGEYTAKINLHKEIKVEIKLDVVAE